eukprot:TRINITY_DN2566_c0_g1_i1.p1 TRINITY_DN2566_c0_g1~~TRINITY_DN2566_c0_g1_i1.p1  ORF type:complete len:177 (+),score=45.38 TRINITY_DN2566_c0_g1_i1:235-765(+)
MSLYTIKGMLVLDAEGKRVAAKYYGDDYPTTKDQLLFEKNLFTKTHRANSEIILFDNIIAVYRSAADIYLYVIGSADENELILASVLTSLYETLSILLRNQFDKRTLLENIDYVLLALDELVDGGIILESEPSIIASRVAMKGADTETTDIPLSEQTISQAIQLAREQLTRSLLKG